MLSIYMLNKKALLPESVWNWCVNAVSALHANIKPSVLSSHTAVLASTSLTDVFLPEAHSTSIEFMCDFKCVRVWLREGDGARRMEIENKGEKANWQCVNVKSHQQV